MHPSENNAKQAQVFEEFFQLGLQEASSPFLTRSSRRMGINLTLKASVLAAFLLAIAFVLHFSPKTAPLANLLVLIVYFLAGIPSLIEAVEDLFNLEINIDILMTLAAFSSVLIGSSLEGGLLLVLFALSGAMEDAVTLKAKGAISTLHRLSPSKASVIDQEGHILERSVKDIVIGTHILIRAGEVVPLDGMVIAGSSSVNMVHLTGENLPVTKAIGDTVPAGAFNQEGVLTLQVTHTSADSTLARIIELVTQAQEARPTLQRWFDKLSNRYATSIILLSSLFAVSFPFILGIPFLGFEGSLYRALAFLIAASPCALIIAIPIAYLSSVSACAKKGILLKGGIILDALARCSIIAFDKTGTLTLGELQCLGLESLEPDSTVDLKEALAIAAALERNAVHPIAKAVNSYAQQLQTPQVSIQDFKSIPGYGLEGVALLGQKLVRTSIGHLDYIASLICPSQAALMRTRAAEIHAQGELLAILLVDSKVILFRFVDTPRPNIRQMIEALKRQKWHLLMLTGDHENNAKKVAQELGIDHYYANLKPEDKLEHVDRLSKEKGLAMIGDGINDAPALARATVGICMGKVGSATAIEAADVVLLHDNLELLDWLMKKARKTQLVVKQNLLIAAGAILVATIPALCGWVPLWLAVVLHEGGTLLVGLNALRLLKR